MYRQRVSLGIEHILVEWYEIRIITEQQKQILQRLSEPEALHLVPEAGICRRLDVVDGGVALRQASVLLKALEYPPAPLPVYWITCDPVQIKQALHCLGTLQIVRVCWL